MRSDRRSASRAYILPTLSCTELGPRLYLSIYPVPQSEPGAQRVLRSASNFLPFDKVGATKAAQEFFSHRPVLLGIQLRMAPEIKSKRIQ